MKRPVPLAVDAGAASFAPLLDALAAAGERAGWLDLRSPVSSPPAELEEAAAVGVLRAVSAAAGRVTTVKPIRGPAVLDDLLREHFRGCRLVLVRGAEKLVRLEADGDGWRLLPPVGGAVRQSTKELVAGLGRPSFWRRLGRARGEAPEAIAAD